MVHKRVIFNHEYVPHDSWYLTWRRSHKRLMRTVWETLIGVAICALVTGVVIGLSIAHFAS